MATIKNSRKIFDECLTLCSSEKSFRKISTDVDGVRVYIFNYSVPKPDIFFKTEHGQWMRGLTFIDYKERDMVVYPMFQKFFNVDENKYSLYEDLNRLGIDHVTEKLDGSLIMPVRINRKVLFKTKNSFVNDHAKEANTMLSGNSILRRFVDDHVDDYSLLFELVSPRYKIVIDYEKTELKLLAMINIKTFQRLGYDEMRRVCEEYGIPCVVSVPRTNLSDLMKLSQQEEGLEGWVVQFNTGKMAKVKTEWYFEKHKIMSRNNSILENKIVEYILDETIDDVTSQLTNEEMKERIWEIENKISDYYNSMVDSCLDMYKDKYIKECNKDRKTFAQKYNKEKLFPLVAKSLPKTETDVFDEKIARTIKDHILRKTSKLEMAKEFLEGL